MSEVFLFPDYEKQYALEIESQDKKCKEFLCKFMKNCIEVLNKTPLIRYQETIPLYINHNDVIEIYKKIFKKEYQIMRNKGWVLKVNNKYRPFSLVVKKANSWDRFVWWLQNSFTL